MPARPPWSGSIQISLVSIAVRIYHRPLNPPRQVEFHQIDRKTASAASITKNVDQVRSRRQRRHL